MPYTLKSFVKLNYGVSMPLLGLGVYLIRPGRETYQAVRAALESGYRLIDTASLYGNEEDVGRAVKDSALQREEVFITTKLWNGDHGYDSALRAFDASLRRLGLGYIDLYLIHFPVPNLRDESWRALEKILQSGRARAIGVSNYTERHLKELLHHASVVPAVNQVEFSPFLYSDSFLRYCEQARIQAEAYSPLTRGEKLSHPVVKRVAAGPGDRVTVQGDEWRVEEAAGADVPAAEEGGVPGRIWALGEEEYFLVGDAPDLSTDARHFGPTSRRDILARAWVVYWPPRCMRVVK